MSSSQDWIFTKEFLDDPTSPRFNKCGMKESKMYQKKTIMFMEDLGAEMKCEKVVVATACVFFHRFYVMHSYKSHNRFNMAVACLFLASKTEEMMVKLRDIVLMYFRVRNPTQSPTEMECKEMQKNVLLAERILLQTMGFDMTVSHPHTPLLQKLRELKNYIPEDKRKEMYETAIAFITDSYRTSLCLQYPPTQLLYGAIMMSAIQLSLQPVSSSNKATIEQSWFDILERERDIDEASMKNICFQLMDLYDDEDNSLKCAIKDKTTSLRNITQIVGGETKDTSKPSPTGISDGEVAISSSSTSTTVTKTVSALYLQQQQSLLQDEEKARNKTVTVTSFLKPHTPLHPRSGSLGSAPLPTETTAAPLDYSSDHSTFSEANRELSRTPAHHTQQPDAPPQTPTIDQQSTPFTSYPCTPNFDSCPPPAAMREQDYRYLEVKTQFLTGNNTNNSNNLSSSSNDDNNSAPKRARIE
jgi:hypothetical protein